MYTNYSIYLYYIAPASPFIYISIQGPVRLKQHRVRKLDPTDSTSRDYHTAYTQCRRGTAIDNVIDFYGPCYLPYAYHLRDRPPYGSGELRAAAAASAGYLYKTTFK
jgi:hypothetical protein